MIKLEKKHIKIFSVAIAVVFVGSVVALALTQMGGMTGRASAASTSIGVIDFGQVMRQSTDYQDARTKLDLAASEEQQAFESKAAGMSDEEKATAFQQAQERLAKKEADLLAPIQKKIEAEIKSVAEAKGLQVVISKAAVAYGGTDITQDVVRKLAQ